MKLMKYLNCILLALVGLLLFSEVLYAAPGGDLNLYNRASLTSRTGYRLTLGAQSTDNIEFVTNGVQRGYINGSTGALTGFSIASPTLTSPTISGNLTFSTAAAKIIPGATSLTFRNNADSADNLSITNAGIATIRAGAVIAAGNFTLSTADQTVFLGATAWDSDILAQTGTQPHLFIGDNTNQQSNVAIAANTAVANGPVFDFFKTRAASTFDADTIVSNGDILGFFNFYGADGASYRPAARILVTVDGTPGSSDMPGAIDFSLSPDGSATTASVLKLSNTKAAQFTGTIRSSATGSLGWTVVNATNQACNTTCTSACVIGIDILGTGGFLDCATDTADSCLCAGAS